MSPLTMRDEKRGSVDIRLSDRNPLGVRWPAWREKVDATAQISVRVRRAAVRRAVRGGSLGVPTAKVRRAAPTARPIGRRL